MENSKIIGDIERNMISLDDLVDFGNENKISVENLNVNSQKYKSNPKLTKILKVIPIYSNGAIKNKYTSIEIS